MAIICHSDAQELWNKPRCADARPHIACAKSFPPGRSDSYLVQQPRFRRVECAGAFTQIMRRAQ